MAPRSGRHYVGNFDLPGAASPTQSAPAAPATRPAADVRLPRAAPPARIRMGEHRSPVRTGPSERTVAPALDMQPLARDEVYLSPDERLSGLQKEMLAALDAETEFVRPDLILEARNVIRGNLKRTTIPPTGLERKIFQRIGVPGY